MSDGKLFIDQIMFLDATVDYTDGSSDSTVTWESSDPTVASVTATGVLTGISGGVATISATSIWTDIDGNTITDQKTLIVEGKAGSQAIYTLEYSGAAGSAPTSSSVHLLYSKSSGTGELVPSAISWSEFEDEPSPYINYLSIDQLSTSSSTTKPRLDIRLSNLRPNKNYRIKVILDGIVSFIINEESDSAGDINSLNEHPYLSKEVFSELTQSWTNFSGTMDVILISEL